MTRQLADCARCARTVGKPGRVLCARCHWAAAHAPIRRPCPNCGKTRVLDTATGRCRTCSHVCTSCGNVVLFKDRDTCKDCRRHARDAIGRLPCPRCGKLRQLHQPTGWCGSCSHPGRTPRPDTTCINCGKVLWLFASGYCRRCHDASPQRVRTRAANLTTQLEHPPLWLDPLAEYLIARYHPGRAYALFCALATVLTGVRTPRPQAILDRIAQPWQRRALQDFFASHRLALPADDDEQHAADRRQRRLDAVPEPLRPAAAAFAQNMLDGRRRARIAGTKPRSHHTVDARLDAVRDFANFLTRHRAKNDWALANRDDVEAFLATRNTKAPPLTGLKQFFGFAARRKLILIDPTRDMNVAQPFGFRGPTLSLDQQRQLFHRWTTQPNLHPHETFVGLAALLHGATTTEICTLTIDHIDTQRHSVRLGRRPQPTPLDPWTWTALANCMTHRESLRTTNPHLLITRMTRGTTAAPSTGYVKHTLDPVGLQPRILRSSRLLDLVTAIDPKLVAATYGMTREAVVAYLADRIDPVRVDELVKLQPTPRT